MVSFLNFELFPESYSNREQIDFSKEKSVHTFYEKFSSNGGLNCKEKQAYMPNCSWKKKDLSEKQNLDLRNLTLTFDDFENLQIRYDLEVKSISNENSFIQCDDTRIHKSGDVEGNSLEIQIPSGKYCIDLLVFYDKGKFFGTGEHAMLLAEFSHDIKACEKTDDFVYQNIYKCSYLDFSNMSKKIKFVNKNTFKIKYEKSIRAWGLTFFLLASPPPFLYLAPAPFAFFGHSSVENEIVFTVD